MRIRATLPALLKAELHSFNFQDSQLDPSFHQVVRLSEIFPSAPAPRQHRATRQHRASGFNIVPVAHPDKLYVRAVYFSNRHLTQMETLHTTYDYGRDLVLHTCTCTRGSLVGGGSMIYVVVDLYPYTRTSTRHIVLGSFAITTRHRKATTVCGSLSGLLNEGFPII